VKEDQGQKYHEQETFDGSGVMLQNMVCVPTLDQLIESVVFDIPSLPPKATTRATGTRADGSVIAHTQSLVCNSSFLSG
jgi:hypothetical protein